MPLPTTLRCATGGAVLDLCSSWVSHLPPDVSYSRVIGHGTRGPCGCVQMSLTRNGDAETWYNSAAPILKSWSYNACGDKKVQNRER